MIKSLRRLQLQRKRAAEKERRAKERLAGKVLVNQEALAPNVSYSTPEFCLRGFYEDMPFQCKDCGKQEVWKDTQQKWWYEVAKGDVWSSAVRCRPCRRAEASRKAKARAQHLEGIDKKKKGVPKRGIVKSRTKR